MTHSLLWTDDGVFIAFGSRIVRRLHEREIEMVYNETRYLSERMSSYVLGIFAVPLEGE